MSAAVGVRWGAVLGVCTGWSGEDSESRARGRCAGGSAASQVEGAASAKALRQWCAWFCAQQQKKAKRTAAENGAVRIFGDEIRCGDSARQHAEQRQR